MFNEVFQVLIAVVAIAIFVVVFYYFAKESSSSTIPNEVPDKLEEVESTSAQQTSIESSVASTIVEECVSEETNRRKSDKIIPKRIVPHHTKITKQNFSEFAGERILVAEDNPINQKVLVGLLGESGIELVLANDGQEALDILENDTNFLMILMDAHMPRVDGFEATRIIRANPTYDHIVVVALSGDIAADDIQKMKEAGMSEQLAKPLRMEALYEMIYAYSGKGIQHDETVPVIQTLDIDKGLQTCGGDEVFYREILSEFLSDYGNSAEVLGNFLRTKNLQSADGLLLDIIGVTANIGADTLETIASNLKLSLKDTEEQSYFSLFDQYKLQLDRLQQEIRAYVG